MKSATSKVSAEQRDTLVQKLKTRFEKNRHRHKAVEWMAVQTRLDDASADALRAIHQMEATGGEPDVVGVDRKTGAVTFVDCSAESPAGRRSLCYDRAALDARKEHKPKDSAMDVAKAMGVELLTEEQYRQLQALGEFDLKTSSWVHTPPAIRQRGGALFCDRRYGAVFLYHNGAESYYAARGFRASVTV